jgi:hypothetical protein
MVRVITGDQADTAITHILIGIIGFGRAATGAIAKGLAFASQRPRNLRGEISLPQFNN